MTSAAAAKALPTASPDNLRFLRVPRPPQDEAADVLAGLQGSIPTLSPKYFYDSDGSVLFQKITELPEYYLTRAEAEIFEHRMDEIVAAIGLGDIIIEPGSGDCSKVRPLLAAGKPSAYVPIDIAADFLLEAATDVALAHPETEVFAVAADFTHDWEFASDIPAGRRIVFYPGSTLGNLEPDEAQAFLSMLKTVVGDSGGVLVGVDLHKDTAVLEAAYDDAAGVTADFNRNMLSVVNAHTGANFDPQAWQHRASYNETHQRIEMSLIARSDQHVKLAGTELAFPKGIELRTEHSHKFTEASLRGLAKASGFDRMTCWQDSQSRFMVALLEH